MHTLTPPLHPYLFRSYPFTASWPPARGSALMIRDRERASPPPRLRSRAAVPPGIGVWLPIPTASPGRFRPPLDGLPPPLSPLTPRFSPAGRCAARWWTVRTRRLQAWTRGVTCPAGLAAPFDDTPRSPPPPPLCFTGIHRRVATAVGVAEPVSLTPLPPPSPRPPPPLFPSSSCCVTADAHPSPPPRCCAATACHQTSRCLPTAPVTTITPTASADVRYGGWAAPPLLRRRSSSLPLPSGGRMAVVAAVAAAGGPRRPPPRGE